MIANQLLTLAMMMTGSLFGLWTKSHAQINPSRRFDFDKPFVLTAPSLNINASWRRFEYNEKSKNWDLKRDEPKLTQCETKIEIQGRDLATGNPLIGEHYYGRMEFNCKSAGSSWRAFKTRFERVLFLGVRNCVESETTVDSDYCELSAVAFRRITDMSKEQGDLDRSTAQRREEYGISGQAHARSIVNKYRLIPQGLAHETLNSVQYFRLMVNQRGNEFFIPGDSLASGFHVENHVLKVDPQTFQNDEKLQDQIHKNLSSLESIVSRFQTSGPGTPDQIQAITEFVNQYNQTARALLQIVSPSAFFRMDRQLAELQVVLAEGIRLQSTATSSVSLARRLQDYEKISAFMKDRSASQLKYSIGVNLMDLPAKAAPVVPRSFATVESALEKSFHYGPLLPFGDASNSRNAGLSVRVIDKELDENDSYYEVSVVDLGEVPESGPFQVGKKIYGKDFLFVRVLRRLALEGTLKEGVYDAQAVARAAAVSQCRNWINGSLKSEDQRLVACQVSSWSSDEGWLAEAKIITRNSSPVSNTSVENP